MKAILVGTVAYVGLVLLAYLIGVSFAAGAANALLASTAVLACGAAFVLGVVLLTKRMEIRPWLRACIGAVSGLLALPIASIVALVVAFSAAERPDYERQFGGSVCRGWVYGGATVALKDERTEVALFRPFAAILERRLGARSWRGDWGGQFTGFEGECANLHAQSGG